MAGVHDIHLAQAAIMIRDQERAKSFYRDKLGLRHLLDAPPALSFFNAARHG